MATRKGPNCYPRPGERIAPKTLHPLLLEKVPGHLAGEGLRLCDLDESAWEKVPPEAIDELAEMVVDRVVSGCSRKVFRRRHFPRPAKDTNLADLHLEHRTRLCLFREGYGDHPERLGDHTIGEILDIRAFGPRCLVDLLSSLETWQARQRRLDENLTSAARRLADLPEADSATVDDPRFGPLISEVDIEAANAKDLADRLIARSQDPPDPAFAFEQVSRLHEQIARLPNLTMEEEMIEIFASTPHERNREILIGYYGWKDGRGHTLAEIGANYGMTRERTRQICAKLVNRKNPKAILAPALDRALDFIQQRLPIAVTDVQNELSQAGLTAVNLRLENIQKAASLLDRPIPFALVAASGNRLAVDAEHAKMPLLAAEIAKKEAYYHGVANVDRIQTVLQEKYSDQIQRPTVAKTLELVEGFRWLDEETGWFWLSTTRKHGLPKAIQKVLSVAKRLPVAELRTAVGRNRRMWPDLPPENVILEFCRQVPDVVVEGDLVGADPPLCWTETLTGVEAQLVKILKTHGPVMERGELEDLCASAGMNRFSFHAFVACSAVIKHFGHSVYGLIGTDVSDRAIESLIARRKAGRSPSRVLDSHGQTEDGRVWLTYRLSKAASTYAVITIPAALKDSVTGKFRLLTTEGQEVGTLATKNGRAWGLGAFLRQRAARVDDRVTLTLDLDGRTAVISIDSEVNQLPDLEP
jgi:sigma-70-like protein